MLRTSRILCCSNASVRFNKIPETAFKRLYCQGSTRPRSKKIPFDIKVHPSLSSIRSIPDNVLKFDDLVARRRLEAQRSIVVQVLSDKSYPELHAYCSKYGQIERAHHYRISNYNGNFNYVLVEFQSPKIKDAILKSSCYSTDYQKQSHENPIIPVQSPFLYFGKGKSPKISGDFPLQSINSTQRIGEHQLMGILGSAQNLEDQIMTLYNATKLTDVEIRLRFLAALQVETAVKSMFPHAVAYPFGSSMNGFGKTGCDLDLILRIDCDQDLEKGKESRLIFHTKEFLSNTRLQTQRNIDRIGDLLELFLPGVGNVRRILKARIPIVKYNHELLDLEIDLSMSNLSGVYMSELLYLFGELDVRVKPLVFVIRKWANAVGLTNSVPGPWITNFSLTSLVLFFLQQVKRHILPPINLLVKSATAEDHRMTMDNINCTFLRDMNKLKFVTKNGDSLGRLLFQFFEFYSQFDFGNRAISLNEARTVIKPDDSAMYIINPLELGMNVSKNLNTMEVDRFKVEVRNAVWFLESSMDKQSISKGDHSWGLTYLLKQFHQPTRSPSAYSSGQNFSSANKKPLVDVKRLFDDEEGGGGDGGDGAVELNSNSIPPGDSEIRTNPANVTS